ncbi:MAG: helix-turn-helix domain-containing protein, partial [Rhizobiales bacterium]|nr:helix-turn-helix domain-containing protein [Hyphomicrobiales bacterium]
MPARLQSDRRFVLSLARGLDVLSCFSSTERWLPNREIARRTGLPKATVSR